MMASPDIEAIADSAPPAPSLGDKSRLSESDGAAEMSGKERSAADVWDWQTDPNNPHNWKTSRKWAQVAMMAPTAFLT
jgi:hypothetical protein